jgi:hypothetical protein
MSLKVALGPEPGPEPEEQDVTGYALAGWDRTARLCAIRLSESLPAFAPLLWVLLHH